MYSAIDDAYRELENEFRLVKEFLNVVNLQEARTHIRASRPIAVFRDNVGPVRKEVVDYVRVLVQDALQMVIVLCVSRLESFLRVFWEERVGEISKPDRTLFSNPRKFAGEFAGEAGEKKGVLLFVDEAVKNDAQAVVQERHVLVHNGGKIDDNAIKQFEKAGRYGFKSGDKLQLSVDLVRRDIKCIESFVSSVRGVE